MVRGDGTGGRGVGYLKGRWDCLPSLRINIFGKATSSGGQEVVADANKGFYGLPRKYSKSQARLIVQDLCREYAESYPTRSNQSGNHTLHAEVRHCLINPHQLINPPQPSTKP